MYATSIEPSRSRCPRYDLLAVNLTLAVISGLLMAAVGSTVKVVRLLERSEIAGVEVNLAVGAALNPGVLAASAAIFFAMSAAIFCAWHNRLEPDGAVVDLVRFLSWAATSVAMVFFLATLILAPLSLAVQIGI